MWFNYLALTFNLFAVAFFMVGSYSLYHDSKRELASYVYLALSFIFSALTVLQINRIIEGTIANV